MRLLDGGRNLFTHSQAGGKCRRKDAAHAVLLPSFDVDGGEKLLMTLAVEQGGDAFAAFQASAQEDPLWTHVGQDLRSREHVVVALYLLVQ